MYDSQVFKESAKMNPPRTNAFKNNVGEEEYEDILKMGCVERELWMYRMMPESVNCGAGDKILSTEGSCNLCGAKVDYTKFWSQSQRLADGKNDWLGFCQIGSLRASSQEKPDM